MQRLMVEVESAARAKELFSMLSALNFVKKVSAIKSDGSLAAEEKKGEGTAVSGSNSVAADKILSHIKEGLEEGLQIKKGLKKALTRQEFKAQLRRD